jgi:uncharacterized protein YneF (UPF0154 family)
MGAFVRIVSMSNLLALFLIVVFFIAGFWLGVHAYRDQLRKSL